MKKWNLVVDVAECTNCNNCFIACKDEYVDNEYKGYSAPQPLHGHKWINILKKERGRFPLVDITYMPTMCNHCDNAPCMERGDGAVTRREDGIIVIDPDKARDRHDIVDSCPYGAIWWNEEYRVPQIWSFDAHLLDRGWKTPRCVQTCPTGALSAVKISDEEMAELSKNEGLRVLKPELDTKPRVYYKNLHRYDKLFVAGEVLGNVEGILNCLFEARVDLYSKGIKLGSVLTDEFGDFRIDGVEVSTGNCELHISHNQFVSQNIEVLLEKDCVVIDEIFMIPTKQA